MSQHSHEQLAIPNEATVIGEDNNDNDNASNSGSDLVIRLVIRNAELVMKNHAAIGAIVMGEGAEYPSLLSKDVYPDVENKGYYVPIAFAATTSPVQSVQLRACLNDMNVMLKEMSVHGCLRNETMTLSGLHLTTCVDDDTFRMFTRVTGAKGKNAIFNAFRNTFGRLPMVSQFDSAFYVPFVNTSHVSTQCPHELPNYSGFDGLRLQSLLGSQDFGLFHLSDVTVQLEELCPSGATTSDPTKCKRCQMAMYPV